MKNFKRTDMVLCGLLLTAAFAIAYAYIKIPSSYNITQAKVVDTSGRGQSFLGVDFNDGSRTDYTRVDGLIIPHTIGSTVTIGYNPEHTVEAKLKPSLLDTVSVYIAAAIMAIIAYAIGTSAVSGLRNRSKTKTQ